MGSNIRLYSEEGAIEVELEENILVQSILIQHLNLTRYSNIWFINFIQGSYSKTIISNQTFGAHLSQFDIMESFLWVNWRNIFAQYLMWNDVFLPLNNVRIGYLLYAVAATGPELRSIFDCKISGWLLPWIGMGGFLLEKYPLVDKIGSPKNYCQEIGK